MSDLPSMNTTAPMAPERGDPQGSRSRRRPVCRTCTGSARRPASPPEVHRQNGGCVSPAHGTGRRRHRWPAGQHRFVVSAMISETHPTQVRPPDAETPAITSSSRTSSPWWLDHPQGLWRRGVEWGPFRAGESGHEPRDQPPRPCSVPRGRCEGMFGVPPAAPSAGRPGPMSQSPDASMARPIKRSTAMHQQHAPPHRRSSP